MKHATAEKVLVVLSGGQDSTTCLYWAIDRYSKENVSAVTFDYGQRHRIELNCAQNIAEQAGIEQIVLPINTFASLGGNALTGQQAVETQAVADGDLPNTFVPGRNLIFLTYAAAFAYQREIGNIVTGVAQTDYSGYPDCRETTLQALENAIQLGMEFPVKIHTPLMHLSKAETVLLAEKLGALPAMALTHTCYNGEQPPCGNCAACELRAKGFAEAGITDPLVGEQ